MIHIFVWPQSESFLNLRIQQNNKNNKHPTDVIIFSSSSSLHLNNSYKTDNRIKYFTRILYFIIFITYHDDTFSTQTFVHKFLF